MTAPLDIPAPPVHLHRPRRHRRARPRRGDRALPRRRSAWRSTHQETNEEQGVREAMVAVGDSGSLHPAARPARRELHDREVPRPLRPGPPAARLPRHRRRAGLRDPARARPPAAVRRPASAAPPTPGSTSSTPRTPAACSSSWSSPPRHRCTLRDALTPRATPALPTGNLSAATPPTKEQPRAADPRRHPRRRHLRRGLRRPRAPRVLPGRHRPQGRGRHVRGPGEPATRTRASRCTSTRWRCPSSARTRRSSR